MTLLQTVRHLAPYFESWLEFQRDHAGVPGVQVAVRVGTELAASFALGQANARTGEALTTRHLFRIASHSKSFTATAIFQLLEAGRLRLDDPAGRWLPELAGSPAAGYTVRELLGHQSGINRDGADSDYWQQLAAFPDRETLLDFCRAEAVYGPNEHFKYSNMGYGLLGLIVEAASGRSYPDYVAAHLTGPLGLENLGPELPAERENELATGHSARLAARDERRPLPSSDTRALAAATGFYGTAEDLTRFWAAHAYGEGTLLSDASKRLMGREETRLTKPSPRGYGLGLILTEVGGRTLVGHSGGFPGHITQSWLDPRTGLAVSVLSNALGAPSTEWATNLVRLIDLAQRAPTKAQADAPGVALDRFTGRYAGLWGLTDLVDLGGRLVSLYPSGDPEATLSELTVLDDLTLATSPEAGFGSVGEPFHFQRGENGRVQSYRQGGGRAWPLADYRALHGLD